MGYIKNFDILASNDSRKVILELIETAFTSITPNEVFKKNFLLEDKMLKIQDKSFDLSQFERVILLGFGKGSAEMCKILESKLGDVLTEGYVIDVVEQTFNKLQ